MHNASVAFYLHVYAERYDLGWNLIDWPSIGVDPNSGERSCRIYRSRTIIDAFTSFEISSVASIEPIGKVGVLPNDLSPNLRAILDDRIGGWTDAPCGHIFLSELIDFDWNRTAGAAHERLATEYADRFDANRRFPEDLADVLWMSLLPQGDDRGKVVHWIETYGDLVGNEFLADVRAVAAFAGDDPARLVYWAG